MSRMLRRFPVALLVCGAACADCSDLDSRGAEMEAQISAPGAPIEQAIHISVSEVRSPTFKSVGFVVTGSDLRWHVRGVRLVESTGEGRVLYDIPLGMPSTDAREAESGQLINTDPDVGTWQHFLVLLETNGVVVELTTDVAGLERVLRPIRAENATDWFSPPCPYTD